MKEKIHKLACQQGWRPEYLMEALEALAEDAFGAVSVHQCLNNRWLKEQKVPEMRLPPPL